MHPRIWMAREQHLGWVALQSELHGLEAEMQAGDWTAVRARLGRVAGLQ